MSNPPTLLDDAFKEALLEAATLDQQGITEDDDYDLFGGHPPSNVELVQECLGFYRKNQIVIDAAIQSALNFLESPHGVAHVKALEASFESPEPNPLSIELASEILSSAEFAGMSSVDQAQGLQGFGIGVSAGASAFTGPLAGADIVFDFQNKAEVNPRTWVGLSFKSGLSVNAGLELSFWVDKPVTGAIGGWLLDLYLPTPPTFIVVFIRFMYIKAREPGTKNFTFSGVSLQFPLGIGFPIRRSLGKKSRLVALFLARQTAWARSLASLKVVDKATGVNTITAGEVVTLAATLKNKSGEDVGLSAGATMTIGMPSYFAARDVKAMNIAYQGWTFTHDGDKLKLTLSEVFMWKADAEISFDITHVQSSGDRRTDKGSERGVVKLTLSDTSFDSPIATAAELDLVGSIEAGTDDALYSGTKCYFFSGNQYIRVTRGDTGPGTVDPGYPAPISNWGWGSFGKKGINAALYSGSKCYFFAGDQYIRVSRDDTGPGTVDAGYPAPISNWGWGSFGEKGIDTALYSGTKCYFFAGDQYIRVTRGDTGPGTVDAGYPAPISDWGWGSFGQKGIDAALYSGTKCYFFAGDQYIRVTLGKDGPGPIDPGYPKSISEWDWPVSFKDLWVNNVALPLAVES